MSDHSSTFRYGGHVHANGIRQHYLRYGGAEGERAGRDAVILVPGITSPAVTWGFVAEHLGRRFDTYVLDVRGRGLSSSGPGLDYGLDAQAADVIALAQALGLQRWALVGHSMGGRIAVRAARGQPAGLTRLVIVDPPVSGPGRRAYPAALPWYVDSIRQATQGMDAEAMRAFCPTWTEEQRRLRAQWLHTCYEPAIVQSFEDFGRDDIHADLPRIPQPLLLVTAERGDVVRDADVAEWQGLAPQTRHVRVPGAGHMIPWDNEAGFYAALGDFLGTKVD
ncbi:alpha/beta hydrolase [Paracidovorax citrulli]|uniref:Alpha/beta hydrolase fold protein n=2 Tax=Paracidovorax citrulli TaxID=80869 RepID=A1TU34_PARC0|nr:alpha/beta hydrolase [Paracidovorax citrulli]ABM34472.1 alpha/beta hydrolase fold protein [Paracidovorax citrulli AAC00-1]ATG93935.1 alpha/beta hydrolase [Paracidovorax citrulli]PVY63913.1 N-formylmaleamate deformylase [Paracidovorax citrulli]QCX09883.1 N-formylmaleamate deformylase [Paracidovorax citrulli]REG67125.1 N-formylmaleamate deformylase [Paracidovorax citrulli]